jgi:hypothetical protein
MKTKSVEIIILHYRGFEKINECLKSIKKNTAYKSYKITIVDNPSGDGSLELVKKNYPKINLIENPANFGFARANNIAARKSTADYLVFLNDDTLVTKNWLAPLVKEIKSDKRISTCQPKMINFRDKRFDHVGAAGGFMDIFGYPVCRGRVFDTREEDRGQYNDKISTFWSGGAAFIIKRSVFLEARGFDEDFFAYSEEIDLCWRLNLMGYRHVYVPNSKIYHWWKATFKESNFKADYYLHRNHLMTVIKNYSALTLLKILPARVLLEISSGFNFLTKGNVKRAFAVFLGLTWNLANIGLVLKKHREVQKKRKIADKKIIDIMIKKPAALSYFILGKKYFGEL